MQNEIEIVREGPGLFGRAAENGPIVLGGLALLLLAGALLLLWLLMTLCRRRRHPILGTTAVCLAFIGYLAYDWRHLKLNLSMRNPDAVRRECIELIKRVEEESSILRLSGSEIPPSIARLGATSVGANFDVVGISLISGDWGSKWGFLYDPKRVGSENDRLEDIRGTWYRDFYEYRVMGE